MKVKNESEVAQSCLPGSCVHGIFQARVLEWGAITFSDIWVYGEIHCEELTHYMMLGSPKICKLEAQEYQ